MATVHTEYGPGRIIDQETVRGRTRYKVAGEGFEVWVDQTKLGGYESPGEPDLNAPHWDGYDLGDQLTGEAFGPGGYAPLGEDEYNEYADPRGRFDRDRMRTHPDYLSEDDPDFQHYANRLAWAPMDNDNSTELPYDPTPQHDAVDSPGDDGSATLQPIHHIDADERLRPSDSISFENGGEDTGPGPSRDLFAAHQREAVSGPVIRQILRKKFPEHYDKAVDTIEQHVNDIMPGQGTALVRGGEGVMDAAAITAPMLAVDRGVDHFMDATSPVGGWQGIIHDASVREANPAALIGPALRVLGPMALQGLSGDHGDSGGMDVGHAVMDATDPGEWGGIVHNAAARPAGLGDKYIDLTASVDYWNDPVAQFRHDPDAYINRVGHVKDEGLNPRFAEYMDLVEADGGIREAAWKDVRKKAMRLKTSGAVHVQDIAPNRIMASVNGDHGTYDVLIYKASSNAVTGSNAISNWHCDCEWGKWAYRRKFTFVGRLCSHAYASYLTMQSAHMRGKPRRKPGDPRNRPVRALPFDKVRKRADNLQNGPQRLTPEMVVNDADDAHIFMDVTKDERDDVGPDDVVSDKDIVHFARLMRHCEVTEQPYPRQLVAFLARYADCNDGSDDTPSDHQASEADDANEYLETLRSDADRSQEKDFGSMAERVHKIQDAVEEAREHGADADRFVASVRKMADGWGLDPSKVPPGPGMDAYNGGDVQTSPPSNRTVPVPTKRGPSYNYDVPDGMSMSEYLNRAEKGNTSRGLPATQQAPASGGNGGPKPKDSQDSPAPKSENKESPLPLPPVGGGSPKTDTPSSTVVNQTKPQSPPAKSPSAPAAGGAGGYTAPGGGQTSGTIADGGVAGAENGDNSAITKSMLDDDGMYTVKDGETWSDIAQRTTGDMNNYQKMYDVNKGVAGDNIDNLAAGTKINLKDFANDVGNGGLAGNITNPAGGGADGDIATVDTPTPSGSAAETGLNAGTSLGAGVGEVNTDTAAGNANPPSPPGGDAATTAVKPPETPAAEAPVETPDTLTPAAAAAASPNAGKSTASLHTARDWLRWAAEGDGTTNSTAPTTEQPDSASSATNPDSGAADMSPDATPGTPSQESDTYDPANPAELEQQSISSANPGPQAGGSNMGLPDMSQGGAGMGLGDVGGLIGQGVGAATDIASGIGNALSGIGSIFSSRQDALDWRRYAYPQAGQEEDLDPHTHPFAGSGYPGSLEIGTSEEYADKARKKHDDVTDLGSGDLTKPMGEWQKQGGRFNDDRPGYSEDERSPIMEENDFAGTGWNHDPAERKLREDYARETGDDPWGVTASIGYSTDDDSDIVRRFQAHLGETALAPGAGQSSGRFDDLAGAAQGFLRTAGRNYSLAEQSELIREGDKGGARNLDSLDLKGTHYEDMTTLGW